MIKLTRAVLSVSDKTGLVELAQALALHNVELISTGGTLSALRSAGVSVRPIEEFTGFPEMMDGRLKTLHPRIHGGILALRDQPEHARAMQEHKLEGFDLVVVNLYPFASVITRPDTSFEHAIENIDIG